MTWSDGSKQLLLGDEVLDIGDLDNLSANQFLFVRHTGAVRFIQVFMASGLRLYLASLTASCAANDFERQPERLRSQCHDNLCWKRERLGEGTVTCRARGS